MESYTRQLFFAMIFSLFILAGWNILFPPKPTENKIENTRESLDNFETDIQSHSYNATDIANFETDLLKGSINLRGLLIDNIWLKNYYEDINHTREVKVLSPLDEEGGSTIDFRFLSEDTDIVLPNADSLWQMTENDDNHKVFVWKNSQGIVFKVIFEFIDKYTIKSTSILENTSEKPVNIASYARIQRSYDISKNKSNIISHEGFIGFLGEVFTELKYKKIQKSDGAITFKDKDLVTPWFGNSDKYWLRAIKPLGNGNSLGTQSFSFRYIKNDKNHVYQGYYTTPFTQVQPKDSYKSESIVFVGPKDLKILDSYSKKYQIRFFDRAIDFGSLYFITKPILLLLNFIKSFVGNYGIAIILLTLLFKVFLFPFATKGYISMGKMKLVNPALSELRLRYKNDKFALNKAIAELYRSKNITPLSNILTLIIQIPIFFALYKVLFVTIDLRQAPFFGWIKDLSAPDPLSIFNLFGLIPISLPSFLQVGIFSIIMGVTMYIQQLFTPKPADATQATIMKFLPVVFTFVLSSFPLGLTIYWIINNTFSIVHQFCVEKIYKAEIEAK